MNFVSCTAISGDRFEDSMAAPCLVRVVRWKLFLECLDLKP